MEPETFGETAQRLLCSFRDIRGSTINTSSTKGSGQPERLL